MTAMKVSTRVLNRTRAITGSQTPWYLWDPSFPDRGINVVPYEVRRLAAMLKNTFPPTMNSEMILNWLMFSDSSSFGIHTPSAYLHWWATLPLLQITFRILQNVWSNCGQLLYTLYGTPLGPGAQLALAFLTTSYTSFQLGSFLSSKILWIVKHCQISMCSITQGM